MTLENNLALMVSGNPMISVLRIIECFLFPKGLLMVFYVYPKNVLFIINAQITETQTVKKHFCGMTKNLKLIGVLKNLYCPKRTEMALHLKK